VVGLHGAEDPLNHGGLKVCGWLHCGEFAGEILPDAEVFRPPGDLLVEFGQSGSDATDCHSLFAGVDVRDQMYFDAAGEIKASFDGCFDDGDLF
jgi:hypothetical protein